MSMLTPSSTARWPSSTETSRTTISTPAPSPSLARSLMVFMVCPAKLAEFFQTPDARVQEQADDPDDEHAGDDQVVASAGVARVDDEVTEARIHRDHPGRHDDEPRDAERDAHRRDDLRQRSGQDHVPNQPEAAEAEVSRRAQVDRLNVLHRGH